MLGSSLVQQLYNTVDLLYVGNILGAQASASIGASTLLITCLIGFFGGLSLGSGVVAAQAFGSRDSALLGKVVHNTVALCLVVSAMLMSLGYLLAPAFLGLTNTPLQIVGDAERYLRIYFLSFPSIVLFDFGASILRALGDAKRPLVAQLIGGLSNVAMDWLFLVPLGMGVAGTAYATLIAQSVSAAYVVLRLAKLDSAYALRLSRVRFEWSVLRQVVGIGVPAGLQSLVITLSNVVVQSCINALGTEAITAFTSYFKVELIIYLPIVAFGQAIMTFSAQNQGAGQLDRVRSGTNTCALLSIALAASTSALAIAFGPLLFGFFVPDRSVVDLGCRIIQVTFPFYFLYSILQVYGDSARGLGRTKAPMAIVLVVICVMRTALLLGVLLPLGATVKNVAAAYPIT